MNTMNYKGCIARIEFDGVDRIFTGRLLGIEEIVTFHGESVTELENSFHASVDNYLGVCVKAEYEFSQGKRGAVLPDNGKTRITIWLDDDVLDTFRNRAEAEGIGYQTLVNQTLRASLQTGNALDEALLRRIIREEMKAEKQQAAA